MPNNFIRLCLISFSLAMTLGSGPASVLAGTSICGGGGGSSGGGGVRIIGGGNGSRVTGNVLKLNVLTITDYKGKVQNQVVADAGVKKEYTKETKVYAKKIKRWLKGRKKFLAKNPKLKYEKVMPVQPFFLKDPQIFGDMITARRKQSDIAGTGWAVYKIKLGDQVLFLTGSNYTPMAVNALAMAEYAKLYNQWVKKGSYDGTGPTSPAIKKVAKDLSQKIADARRKQLVKEEKRKEKAAIKGEIPAAKAS